MPPSPAAPSTAPKKRRSGPRIRIGPVPLASPLGSKDKGRPPSQAAKEPPARDNSPAAGNAPPAPVPPPLTALDRDKETTITVKEAAYRLGKSNDTVYKWLRTGRLRGWQPGGPTCHIQVSEASVSEALRQAAGKRRAQPS